MNFKNNHPEMKTEVETFVIEETQELIYDNDQLEKWNKYVDDLGLTGQKQIVVKDKSPIPFMHLKTSMVAVFECLCPRKVAIEQYNITPIPVEILDLVGLSKREQYFENIEIWYDEKSPDPVCVGLKENIYCYVYDTDERKTYTRRDGLTKAQVLEYKKDKARYYFDGSEILAHYLIGKWADVKHSFTELKEMAIQRFIVEKGNEYQKKIKDAQRGLDDLKQEAFDKFN